MLARQRAQPPEGVVAAAQQAGRGVDFPVTEGLAVADDAQVVALLDLQRVAAS